MAVPGVRVASEVEMLPWGHSISLIFRADFLHVMGKATLEAPDLNPHRLAAPTEGENVIVLVAPEESSRKDAEW